MTTDSSYRSNGGNCVEVATNLAASRGTVPVPVRDSKRPTGPALGAVRPASPIRRTPGRGLPRPGVPRGRTGFYSAGQGTSGERYQSMPRASNLGACSARRSL